MNDIAAYAGAAGGGRLDQYLLAPNNAAQYARVLNRLVREIEGDLYVQVRRGGRHLVVQSFLGIIGPIGTSESRACPYSPRL